jgi:hypothetical protein
MEQQTECDASGKACEHGKKALGDISDDCVCEIN